VSARFVEGLKESGNTQLFQRRGNVRFYLMSATNSRRNIALIKRYLNVAAVLDRLTQTTIVNLTGLMLLSAELAVLIWII